MPKITFADLFKQRDHWILIRGLLYLFVLSIPLVLFVTIMGAGAPNSPGFLYVLGTIVGGMAAGVALFLFMFRVIDCCLQRRFVASSFSYFSILLGAVFFLIYFNIVHDELFQLKQGHFDLILFELAAIVGFWFVVILAGQIRFGKK